MGENYQYDIIFMTARIAKNVADVLEEKSWAYNWETLKIFFRNPDTRVAARKQFQKFFSTEISTLRSRHNATVLTADTLHMHVLLDSKDTL